MKKWYLWLLPLFIIFIVLAQGDILFNTKLPKEITYNEFTEMVEKKEIASIELDKATESMLIVDNEDKAYTSASPNYENFKKELLEAGIEVTTANSKGIYTVISSFITLLIYIFLFFIIFRFLSGGAGGAKQMDTPALMPKTKFNNIAGYQEQKHDLSTYVSYLKDPKEFHNKGATMPKGVLLYGPPGTGKTLFARAIAGEAGVPFYSVGGSDFIEKYVGTGAKRVRTLFKNARKNAPCIIFIDEIDAIGGSRNQAYSSSEHTQTLNALLKEMDGFEQDSGVLVLATTNRPDDLDSALVRSGRFDNHISIPLPTTSKDRLAIMNVHKKERTFADDVDFEDLAKQWVGFSGADIESVLNEATIISVQNKLEKIDKACLEEAFYKKILKGHIKKNGQKERKEEELRLVAYHEAGHAVTRKLYGNGEVSKVKILSTTSGAGGVTFNIPDKMGLFTMEELHNEIKVLYAGRAAEYLLNGKSFSKVTTGAQNDIERATDILKSMIAEYGLQEEPMLINFNKLKNMEGYVLNEMKRLSQKLFEETVVLLEEHYILLETVAERLIETETIESKELNEIVDDYKAQTKNIA